MTSFFGVPPETLAAWMAGAVGFILLGLFGFALINRILLRMALRNIQRRRAQSVLILFGLMLATLIMTASLAIGDTSSYSLQSIETRQIGGIDAAFTRQAPTNVAGAGTSAEDFFSPDQLAAAHTAAAADSNVAATSEALVATGSILDQTTGETSSENVVIFGIAPNFEAVWGTIHDRSGGSLKVSSLAAGDVYIGSTLADHLGAKNGDALQLYVAGHPVTARVLGIVDTEVNPSISNHGPIVSSVLMPLDQAQAALGVPGAVNIVFEHNQGPGGVADLGPQGTTGDEVTRHMRAAFADQASAADLKTFLSTPAIKAQVAKIRDGASFLSPDKQLADRLLVELNKPEATDEFKSLVGDRFVDRIIVQAVTQTVPPSQAQKVQTDVFQRITALQVDTTAAARIKTLLAQPALLAALEQQATSEPALQQLVAGIQSPDVTPSFKASISDSTVRDALGKVIDATAPQLKPDFIADAAALNLTTFQSYMADAVTFAQQGGIVITGALLAVSFFSICVGVLLIFLIFVMLASERRAEMGMSRAVGLKRRHLTQMFLFEGTAYTLAASLIGVVLGVVVGFFMTGVLSTIFNTLYPGFSFQYHVEWTSLVIAACLGTLLTFVVVSISAYRVSKLNIVAAIRDLDESEQRDAGLRRIFGGVFVTAWFGVRQLFRGHPLIFLQRLTLGVLGGIWTFWWALFRRGPMTIVAGAALAYIGSNLDVELIYLAGASLVIIGAGLLLRWILTLARVRRAVASRAGFTLSALGLLVYWGQPFGRVEKLIHLGDRGTLEHVVKLDQMTGGAEVFALSALMVLLGVIWLVMFNSDLLIRGVMLTTGRFASLSPITRTSMAYPMSTKFRTGMAVAMFGIVTFVVVFMSIFQDVLVQNYTNVDQLSGGWQIVAGTPDNNFDFNSTTKLPDDIAARVSGNPATAADIRATGWEDNSTAIHLLQVNADGSVKSDAGQQRVDFTSLHAVDDGYLSATTYNVAPRAAGYSSDRAVWDAVRDHPGYAVVDAAMLDSQNGTPATITGIKRSDASFQPFQVVVQTPAAFGKSGSAVSTWRLTVIGFMPYSNWGGAYVSTRTAMQSGLFGTGPDQRALRPTGYYFAVRPGVSVNTARLDLGRLLAPNQLEPVVVADQLAQQVSGILGLLKLLTGFLALGLIVGIAGLGVISTRAVVERFQQIGMLRALGYRRSLVQRSFLLESSLIAILGLVIGAGVGIWQSYTFFVTNQTFGSVVFHIPALTIALILIGSYAATLLTTYLPSRAAARVAPAEALRYE